MKTYRVPSLLVTLTFYTLCFGQGGMSSARIKGPEFNPEGSPAEYSTVVLMNHDSVFING